MMRSLSSAVAGLRTHQTKMDVIGNNIANVNTYGFKASRASFSDVYYQTLSGAGSAQSTLGGTNPTQIGYGASVATIDMLITQSGMASTDRALDVYIDGDGFLISQDATGKKQYSRLGVLYFDAAGNLVDGNGQYILGFPMITDPVTGEVRPDIPSNGKADSSELVPIKVTPPGSMTIEEFFDSLTGISISNSGQIVGIQNGDTEVVLAAGLPSWINRDSITISPTSTYVGGIRVAISGLPTAAAMSTAIGIAVDKVDFGTIALDADSNYEVTVNQSTNTVTITRPATPTSPAVNISGSLKDGKIVLKNSNGDVGMTIYTSATSLPATGTTTPVTTYPTVQGGTLSLSGPAPTQTNILDALGLNAANITAAGVTFTGTLPGDNYTVTADNTTGLVTLTGATTGTTLSGTIQPNGQLTLANAGGTISIDMTLIGTASYPTLTSSGSIDLTNPTLNENDLLTALGLNASDIIGSHIFRNLPNESYTVTVVGSTVTLTGDTSGDVYTGTVDPANGMLDIDGSGLNYISVQLAPTNTYPADVSGATGQIAYDNLTSNSDWETLFGLSADTINSVTVTNGTLPDDDYSVTLGPGTGEVTLTGTIGSPPLELTGTYDSGTGILSLSDGTIILEIAMNSEYPPMTGSPLDLSSLSLSDSDVLAALGLNTTQITAAGVSITGTPLQNDGSYNVSVDNTTGVVTITGATGSATGIHLQGTINQTTGELVLSDPYGIHDTEIRLTLVQETTYPTMTGTTLDTSGPPLTASLMESALGLQAGDVASITGNLPGENFAVSVSGQTVTLIGNGGTIFQGTLDPSTGSLVLSNTNGALPDVTVQLNGTITNVTVPSTTSTLTMGLFRQMTTTDLGGNTVRIPADPEPFTQPTGFPASVQFGDFSFTMNGPATALNAVISTSGPGEGKRINIGNLAVAKFRNTGGLQQAGSSYFEETANSGQPVCAVPGLEGTGGLVAGYLEMSNVDISKEFTDMITTQRGFQANTRIVTVSDEMLQELVNLKR